MFKPTVINNENMYSYASTNKNMQGIQRSSNLAAGTHNSSSYRHNAVHTNQVPQKQVFDFNPTSNRQQLNIAAKSRPLQTVNLNTSSTAKNQSAVIDRQPFASTNYAAIQEPGPSHLPPSNTYANKQESETKPNTNVKANPDATALVKKGHENVRIFTGTPEKILKWHRMYSNYFCFYEVISAIVSIQEGSVRLQKVMLLRDKTGPILQVVHYVHDHIDIENFFVGQILRCVGRMVGPSIMHAVSIRQAKPDEITTLQRMCFISDHAISKLKKIKPCN